MNGLDRDVDELATSCRAGTRLVLGLDFDGTLAPFVPRPEEARLPAGVREALEDLAARRGVTVAVISGRSLEDLQARVRIPGIHYAGAAGLELEIAGERILPPGAREASEVLCRLGDLLQGEAARFTGAWVERKVLGLTLHVREADPAEAPELLRRARRLLEPFAACLRVLDGPLSLEVFPELDWNKGTALRRIFERAGGPPANVIYAGDEASDDDAFRTARELGGIALGIGPRAPATATHRLGGPGELAGLLGSLRDALRP